MSIHGFAGVTGDRSRRRWPSNRAHLALLGLLALFITLPAWAQTPDPAAPPAAQAEIGVQCDLTRPGPLDLVSVRLMGNKDPQLLTNMVAAIASRLQAQPVDLAYSDTNPRIVTDGSIGFDVRLPVIPRGAAGVLPLSPFVEALAPYVSRLNIAYIITGPFEYRGYEQYENAEVAYTVGQPTLVPGPPQVAIFPAEITIKKQTITTPLPTIREEAPTPGQQRARILLLVMAVIFIAGVLGIVAVLFLPRIQAWAAGGAGKGQSRSKGGSRD